MLEALRTFIRSIRQRSRAHRELDDELAFHLEMETQAHIARGLSPDEARRRARADLGGVEGTKTAVREVRATWADALLLDLRYAARSTRRGAGAGLAAIAMLGLAIGITTAMFTLVDALLLRPVPFAAPHELAFIYMGNERGGRLAVAPDVFRAWRSSPAFAAAEAAVTSTAIVGVDNTVASRGMARVSTGVFDLLGGITPIRGRLFDPGEALPGNDDRVLLSEDVWRELYGADPGLVGRRVLIDGTPLTVIGILPADFRFPKWDTVIWRPAAFASATTVEDRPQVFVRFAPGLPRADAERLATEAARAADASNAKLVLRTEPLAGMVLDQYYQRAIPLLAGGVVLVFLVLCANVSSLLLARFTSRRREFAMRSALGASRSRLMRQAIVESAFLGLLGAAAGLAIGWMLVSLARAFLPEAFLLRTLNPLDIDVRALTATSVAGLVATFAAGLLPAWIGTRVDTERSLRVTDRGGTETRAARAMTRVLLVAEIALACTLVAGATLLVRSFIKLSAAERGLDTRGAIAATVTLPAEVFKDRPSRETVADLIEEQVRALPGVQYVAWSYGIPPGQGMISWGEWQSDRPGAPAADLLVDRYVVGAEFFEAFGIPLLSGRTFGPSDTDADVVVGERFAAALWPGLDPVGRSFGYGKQQYHVIGLVREIHHPSLDPRRDRPEFYQNHALRGVGDYATLSVRCAAGCPDPAVIRDRLTRAHAAVRVHEVRALDDMYFEELARPRASAALGFVFAAIAVIAAAGGLFSVLSYAVGRRRREFGIRTALGASPSQIGGLVLRDGAVAATSGVGLGALASWGLARALASLQYGVAMSDPSTWAIVLGVLAAMTLASAWRPAREAMRSDPVLLLRDE